MNLILIFPEELKPEGRVQLVDGRAAHIRNILRAEPGKVLRIGLLNGPRGCGTVESMDTETVVLRCKFEAAPPPRPAIDLLLAMPRPKVLKRLWAQFAALGVGRIFITNAEKVERYYFDTHVLGPEFYAARLIEGLQQAGDTLLPEVRVVRQLSTFLEKEHFPDIGKKIIADPSGTSSLFQALEKDDEKGPRSGKTKLEKFQGLEKRVLLAIGPEGGWAPAELELFRAHGFDAVSMGPRILRTDTACIAILSQLALCCSE